MEIYNALKWTDGVEWKLSSSRKRALIDTFRSSDTFDIERCGTMYYIALTDDHFSIEDEVAKAGLPTRYNNDDKLLQTFSSEDKIKLQPKKKHKKGKIMKQW